MYAFTAAFLLAISNLGSLRDLFYLPPDFDLYQIVTNFITDTLTGWFGEQSAATLMTGLFWALLGGLIYIVIWIGLNFTIELQNDLVVTRYRHPKGVDTLSPLKHFVLLSIYRSFVGVITIMYVAWLLWQQLPPWLNELGLLTTYWKTPDYMLRFATGILGHMLALHVLVILVRLLLLRKRVLDDDL